eukprot:jgi/Bigna1/88173/estExt_fgenesh1_pg.C_280218
MDRVYSAEQITVPPALPGILKGLTKEVIRHQPQDILDFGAGYFAAAKKGDLKDFLNGLGSREVKAPEAKGQGSRLTTSEKKQILEVFSKIDVENTGSISSSDLQCFDKNGKFFAKLDTSKDGKVSEEEYLEFFQSLKAKNPKAIEEYLKYAQKTLLKMTIGEREGVLDLFSKIDTDGNGVLDKEELYRFDESGKLFEKMDTFYGKIDKGMYLKFFEGLKLRNPKAVWNYLSYAQKCLKKLTTDEEKRVKSVFDAIDVDKSGEIEEKELSRFDKNGRFFGRLIRSLDKNKDGKVSITEYLNYFKKLKVDNPKAIYGFLKFARRLLKKCKVDNS